MPRTSSRKRNNRNQNSNNRNQNSNRENDNSNRESVSSTLSPYAPEFVPSAINEIQLPWPTNLNENAGASTSNSNGNNSNNSTLPDHSSFIGQRDSLISLLNSAKVDCAICYEMTKNVEPIWNCRNCFQIMHLKCIMVWFIKSHRNLKWRCPHCQNENTGKPSYVCFCGSLANPFSNNVDIPHSCGQVCGLVKNNANAQYNDCHHKCTLLCHPGPCPPCVVQVKRKCGCGKTSVYAHCGQLDPIVCQNICSKELACKNHVCEKPCHVGSCEDCKMHTPQNTDQNNFDHDHMARFRYLESLRSQYFNQTHSESHVTEEELIMLGLNPEELLSTRNNDEDNLFMDRYFFDDESSSSDDDDDDENNFSYNSITNQGFLRSRQAIDLFHNQLFSTSNGRASARQEPRENTSPQPAVNPPTARSLLINSSSDLSESTDSEYGSNEIINATSDEYEHSSFADPDSAHSNDDQNSVNDLDFLPTEESDDDHSSSSRNDILSDDSTNTSSSSEISSVENSSYIFSQSSISSLSSVNSSECFFSSDQSSSSF